jgi:hypothetical protein
MLLLGNREPRDAAQLGMMDEFEKRAYEKKRKRSEMEGAGASAGGGDKEEEEEEEAMEGMTASQRAFHKETRERVSCSYGGGGGGRR